MKGDEIFAWEHLKLKLYVIEDWGKCEVYEHAKLGCQSHFMCDNKNSIHNSFGH
jgi:hypothetical protein